MPFNSPGDHPNSGIEPASPALPGEFFITGSSGKPNTGENFIFFKYHSGCWTENGVTHELHKPISLLKAIKLFQNEFSFSITLSYFILSY